MAILIILSILMTWLSASYILSKFTTNPKIYAGGGFLIGFIGIKPVYAAIICVCAIGLLVLSSKFVNSGNSDKK